MERQLGVGIIGCGYWGVNYVRVFSELPETRVVAVCDCRVERLDSIKRHYPLTKVLSDDRELLEYPEISAVIISTPAVTHFDLVRDALEAGKHVLVEKPLTTSTYASDKLIELADARGLTLMVGHTFLFNPGIRMIKEYLDRGTAGKIYYLYARRTNMGPIRHDVSAIWDLAPHDISIFNFWLGAQPLRVTANGANVLGNSHQDVAFITLEYPKDILAHIHVSWADAYKVREVVVVGSEERIVFNDFNPLERVRVFEKGVTPCPPATTTYGEYQYQMRDGDIISPRVDSSEPLKNECRHFVECVVTSSRPLTDGRLGRDVVRVIEMIDASIDRHGTPVTICQEEDAYANASAVR